MIYLHVQYSATPRQKVYLANELRGCWTVICVKLDLEVKLDIISFLLHGWVPGDMIESKMTVMILLYLAEKEKEKKIKGVESITCSL